MRAASAAFAWDSGIDDQHLAVWDGAGWHTARRLVVPDGIDLVPLLPASPELQPDERVWSLLDEPVANRVFTDLDALEATVDKRCQTLTADPTTVRAHTSFHWWTSDLAPAVIPQ